MSENNNGKLKGLRVSPQVNLAEIGELTEEERDAIRARARTKVAEEVKKRKETAYFQLMLVEERQRIDPSETLEPIFLELAPNTEYIMLDGTQFFHGQLYHVTAKVWSVLAEQINRGWAHDEQTQVRDENGQTSLRAPRYIGTGNFVDRRRQQNIKTSAAQMAAVVARQAGIVGA